MATGKVNENIERNYLKGLKIEEKNIVQLKEKFAEKGDELIDLLVSQNNMVLSVASDVYESFVETKEKSQNELVKLDLVLEQVADLNAGSGEVRSQINYDNENDDISKIAFMEFDNKIEELNEKIRESENKIEKEKNKMKESNAKIKDTNEYLSKFALEKKLYLDKVNEILLREESKKFKILYLEKF